MKISCDILLEIHMLQTDYAIYRGSKKFVKSTLALCRKSKNPGYCMFHFSSKNRNGTKYEIINLHKLITTFIKDGKITIEYQTPPHTLYIQADSTLLMSFVLLLKKALYNKLTDNELVDTDVTIMTTCLKPELKKLVIRKNSDYPSKGFPRSLETLHINHIQCSSLDRGILQLRKLRILDLSNNCIEYLPRDLSELSSLKELHLSRNNLGKSTLKQWCWMDGQLSKNLRLLNLSNNNLKFVPKQIVKLCVLVSLHLDFNQISFLPSGIGNLRHLKHLTASHNLISILPGSTMNWKLFSLDISNNSFPYNNDCRSATFSTPLPVFTLKEYAARRVLMLRFSYSAETIPETLVDFLDYANYCVCGTPCFNKFISHTSVLYLNRVSQLITLLPNRMFTVPIDCCFCSIKCFESVNPRDVRHQLV